jgi:thiamine-phosphate pyrophosphorylase
LAGHEAEPEVADARCRLLIRVPAAPSADLGRDLEALAAEDRLAGLVAAADGVPEGLAARLPTALLLEGAFEPEGGADGVVVAVGDDVEMEVTALRRAWGADGLIVVDVGISRHAAMEAGEFGADAVLFDGPETAVADCLGWWQELFVLPAAARATPDTVGPLVAAGADFLLIDGDRVTADVARQIDDAERQRSLRN